MSQIESFAKQQIQVDNLSKTGSLIRLQADSTLTSDGCKEKLGNDLWVWDDSELGIDCNQSSKTVTKENNVSKTCIDRMSIYFWFKCCFSSLLRKLSSFWGSVVDQPSKLASIAWSWISVLSHRFSSTHFSLDDHRIFKYSLFTWSSMRLMTCLMNSVQKMSNKTPIYIKCH